jgi:hypothetical protein
MEREFSTEAIELCKKITKSSYHTLQLCRELKLMLIDEGVISDMATYQEVIDNKKFCRLLLSYVALGLETDVKLSKYGLCVISDFDLYHRMNTEANFNDEVDKLSIKRESTKYVELKKQRNNLRCFVGHLRDNTIKYM